MMFLADYLEFAMNFSTDIEFEDTVLVMLIPMVPWYA